MNVVDVPVNVQMVSVHGSNHGDFWVKLQEGSVEFVRLHDHGIRMAHEQVRVVVLGNSSQKCRAAFAAFFQDMCRQCTCSGLAVCSRNSEATLSVSDFSQNLGAFQDLVAVLLDIHEFAHVMRDGRRIDYQRVFHVFLDEVRIVLIVDVDPFFLQGVGQF